MAAVRPARYARCLKSKGFLLFAVVAMSQMQPVDVGAAELTVSPSIGAFYTSNVFMDRSAEWDFAVQPGLDLRGDFSDFWTAQYSGTMYIYARQVDLMAGWNQVSLMANPAWGSEEQNEFFAQLSLDAMTNTSAYANIDYVSPAISLGLVLEPVAWFRWKFTNREFFRLFYNDRAADGLDSITGMEFMFVIPSRTTITPRFLYSMRFYTEPDRAMEDDRFDYQIEPGVHVSQGLWESGGLQADYSYRKTIGSNALFDRNFSQTQFFYLGEDFLFSGNHVFVKFTQIIPAGFKLTVGVDFQTRAYSDWPAVDSEGGFTGENRYDQRLTPSLGLEFNWSHPGKEAKSSIPDIKINAGYFYTREWSNSYFYDTSWHVGSIYFVLTW